jgi:hypothetical protein
MNANARIIDNTAELSVEIIHHRDPAGASIKVIE